VTTNTVKLHRVLRAKPERVYRAFLELDAVAKWLPPYGFTCTVDQLDAKVGGTYRMSFRNFGTGHGHGMRQHVDPGTSNSFHIHARATALAPRLGGSLQVRTRLHAIRKMFDVDREIHRQSGPARPTVLRPVRERRI
jgi:uncharacterized protein YndB with AHSA1/START domain